MLTIFFRRRSRQERGFLRGEDVAGRENAARSLFLVQDPLHLSGVSLVRFFPLLERNEHKKLIDKSKFETPKEFL